VEMPWKRVVWPILFRNNAILFRNNARVVGG